MPWQGKQNKREELIIGTLNVQNVKSNTEYIKYILKSANILCIQEHWLFSAEKNILTDITNDIAFAAKSVDDDNDPDFNITMKR